MKTTDLEKLKPSQCREIVIKKNYSEFYNFLINNYPSDITFSEKLYWYFNKLNSKPICPVCGKTTIFENVNKGYRKYCSKSCSNKDCDKIEYTKSICIKKFGGIAPIYSDSVKQKMNNTMIEKYGVINCQQNNEIKGKTKKTMIEKYGGQGNASILLKEKYNNTCYKKYNVDNASKNNEIKEKISKSRRNYEINNHKYIIDYINDDNTELVCKCKCPHIDCKECSEKYFIINPAILANRISHNIELCTKLLPIKSQFSTYELKLRQLLDNNNIEYQTSVRNIISKELDIEFNGVYWHSDKIKDKTYHINKYNECLKKGIQLISIWEDQFVNKYNIIESLILHKLGKTNNKIFARKCTIEKIKSSDAQKFYEVNHIQGKSGATVHYGLIYNNEIVSIMSFGKRAIGDCTNWELIRFCNKLNTYVIGAASRLFKYFIKEYNPDNIISWSSNDISNGNMYKQLGFNCLNTTNSYWYISKNLQRYHRSGFNKANLIKKGIIENTDTRSESQIMMNNEYYKIWDSGQTKWYWNK